MIKILFFTVTVLISANSIGQVSATDSTETGVTLTKIDIDNTSELPAEYPGGPFALLTFLSKNMIYPQNASENNIQGKVFIQFIIEKDGTISDVKALNSVLPSIDTEAVRVVWWAQKDHMPLLGTFAAHKIRAYEEGGAEEPG